VEASNAGLAIVPASGTVELIEGQPGATFTLRLRGTPTAPVRITWLASDPSAVRMEPDVLTIPPERAGDFQTVHVNAPNDSRPQGTRFLSLQALVTSDDPRYAELSPEPWTLSVSDLEQAGVFVEPLTPLITTDGGGVAQFDVWLARAPRAEQPVRVSIQVSDSTEAKATPSSVSFDANNWERRQRVTIQGVNDAPLVDGDQAYRVSFSTQYSTDGGYSVLPAIGFDMVSQDVAVDECSNPAWNKCGNYRVCADTPKSYECVCPDGTKEAYGSECRSENRISVGSAHACAKTSSGDATCWGNNAWGRATQPDRQPFSASSVMAGDRHSCLQWSDGTIKCWGDAPYLYSGRKYLSISAAGRMTCAVEHQGVLTCDAQGFYPVAAPALSEGRLFRKVHTSGSHVCALDNQKLGHCWAAQSHTPLLPSAHANTRWQELVAGPGKFCGITVDGQLHCWGTGNPAPGTPDGVWSRVSVGRDVTCAVDTSRRLFCWAVDGIDWHEPPAVGSPRWTDVSVHDERICAMDEASDIHCWQSDKVSPLVIPDRLYSAPWDEVVSAGAMSCVFDTEGQAGPSCWGADITLPASAQGKVSIGLSNGVAPSGRVCWLANGSADCAQLDTGEPRSPPALPSGTTWTAIDTGATASCGIDTQGEIYCWGEETSIANAPNAANARATLITVSNNHACAALANRQITCWGTLGAGRQTAPLLPDGVEWRELDSGESQTCGRTSADKVLCWGYTEWTPTPPDGSFSMLAVGSDHACAGNSYFVTCWGSQSGTWEADRRSFYANYWWTDISAGNGYSCAVSSRGGRFCWGNQHLAPL
jgi:alpha-tubulin suppressor-like RCC1 family protein